MCLSRPKTTTISSVLHALFFQAPFGMLSRPTNHQQYCTITRAAARFSPIELAFARSTVTLCCCILAYRNSGDDGSTFFLSPLFFVLLLLLIVACYMLLRLLCTLCVVVIVCFLLLGVCFLLLLWLLQLHGVSPTSCCRCKLRSRFKATSVLLCSCVWEDWTARVFDRVVRCSGVDAFSRSRGLPARMKTHAQVV